MPNLPANCACGNPIRTAYCIAGLPEVKYCSRSCVDKAFEALVQGRRKETKPVATELAKEPETEPEESSTMETTIKEFGDAAIVRHICDRPGCGKPVMLGWKGRDGGEYCSNECKKISERASKDKIMTTETQAADMADDDSPVTAGKSADKKKKAKAKPKPEPKKPEVKAKSKANGKANGANGAAKGEQVIHLTKTESELKGKRGQIYKLIKNGMTVSQLQEAAAKKLGDDSWKSRALVVLRTCVENNLCTVK